MNAELRGIFKKPCSTISGMTEVDIHSKRFDLLGHMLLLARCAIDHSDLTDVSMEAGISKSQFSKLDTGRSYQIFVGIFYDLLEQVIRAHDFHLYGRLLRILGIDSTFIRTAVRQAGKYRRSTTQEGIKLNMPVILFPATIPMDSIVTPANVNDSPVLDVILSSLEEQHGKEFLKSSILVFDLGYYDLDRFTGMKLSGIPFVTRIKKNAVFDVVKEYAHSRIIRFRNGLELRLVTLIEDGEERNYITDIFDLPDQYIRWIYEMRWQIEIFFREMKSFLKIDHFISRKINGILVQIFSFLSVYLALLIIGASLSVVMCIPEIIRFLRHGIPLPLRKTCFQPEMQGVK